MTSARVRTRDGKLYSANVTLELGWARLTEVRRLSRHGDGYAAVACSDTTIPARDVAWVRWDHAEVHRKAA